MITSETLRHLEFDKVLQFVAKNARSNSTEKAVTSMTVLTSADDIRRQWGCIEEIRCLFRQRISLNIGFFTDIRPYLDEVRPEGAILAPQALLQLIPVLANLSAVSRQFAPRQDIPLLKSMQPQPEAMDDLLEPLSATLDDEGNILDSASAALAEIRKAKKGLAARIRRKLEEIVRKHETAIFLQDDFITIRSGRWVIPVRMDSKGMVPGVVHDVSSSGETAFMEPLEIIPFVNELENLTAEEKTEEIRILRTLSNWIREDADRISASFKALVELDRLDCLAKYAEQFEMSVPQLSENGQLRLDQARHPLLLALRAERNSTLPVVPLDIRLGELLPTDNHEEKEHCQVIVISGPNAGGKTIALKTVGLISLMALAGMPIPASSGSVVPLLDNLLVDIGDEQSIEASLSTFSARVAAIARILEKAGNRSLVLLDELGTGTEPKQGAAIGCAVLNELHKKGALVIATTHLTEIVGFVQRTPAMFNAGMEFDSNTWTPCYRLMMGEPGQSHALETARRYGLPEPVLAFAKELLGDAGTAFAMVIDDLNKKREQLSVELAAAKNDRLQLARQQQKLEQQQAEFVQTQNIANEQSKEEMRKLLGNTRREMNSLLDELRREKRKETAEKLRKRTTELEVAFAPEAASQAVSTDAIKPGDFVHLRSLGRDAQVLGFDNAREKVRVRAGNIELEVPLHGISRAGAKISAGKTAEKTSFKSAVWLQKEEAAPDELNLIGQRTDDALILLEKFVDQAVLAGVQELRIVHGLGSGALQRAVREFLGRHPQIRTSRAGEAHEGRDGVTVAVVDTV